MMKLKFYLLLMFCFELLTLPRAFAVDDSKEMKYRLDNLSQQLESKLKQYHVPGMAIAIVKKDQVIFSKGFGVSNLEKQTPVTSQTLFGIGSTTKAFTATLIGILVDQEKMQWDDPLTKYLPELKFSPKNTTEEITIRDMLSHQTGFTRFNLLYANAERTRQEVLTDAIRALPWLDFRKKFIYNNVMYSAAGEASAKSIDSNWDDLLKEFLLEPLGMNSTTSDLELTFKNPDFSSGYRWLQDSKKYQQVKLRNVSNIAPAAAINSNVNDMSKWLRLQLANGEIGGRQIISQKALKEITTPQIKVSGGIDYGLGWMLSQWQGKKLVAHSGSVEGHSALIAFFPEENLGFVMLTNLTNTPLLNQVGPLVWQSLLEQPKANIAGDTSGQNFNQYLGQYTANFFSFKDAIFSFQVKQGKPFVDIPGEMAYELNSPDVDGKFSLKQNDKVAFSFDKNKAGEVVAMRIHKKGMAFEMPKDGAVFDQEISEDELQKYVGSYPSELFNGNLAVKIQNERLALDIPNKLVAELYQPDADGHWKFRIKPIMSVTFETDDKGKVVALNIYKSGNKLGRSLRVENKPSTLPSIAEILKLGKTEQQKTALIAAGGFTMSGKVYMPQSAVTGAISTHLQHDYLSVETLDFGVYGTITNSLNAHSALSEISYGTSLEHNGKYFEQLRKLHPMALLDWQSNFNQIEVISESKIADKKVYVIKLMSEQLPPYELYLDAKTGDIRQLKMTMLLADYGEIPMSYFFSDYRMIEGVRFPFEVSIDNEFIGNTRINWDSIKADVKLKNVIASNKN